MTGFNHTLIGATIAVVVKQPLLIAPLAFASHFVADSMPHFADRRLKPFNLSFRVYLVVEAILCFTILGICLTVWPELRLALVVGTFFATLPDFFWVPYYVYKLPKKGMFHLHFWVQWAERPYGWIYDLIYGGLFVTLLRALRV